MALNPKKTEGQETHQNITVRLSNETVEWLDKRATEGHGVGQIS
jgi:hypothetical protein